MTWLDVANAYGSIPHKLIMKSLSEAHIPDDVMWRATIRMQELDLQPGTSPQNGRELKRVLLLDVP